MQILDFFRRTKVTETSLSDFHFYYLYGVTSNPNNSSSDTNAFRNLYNKVIGESGGVMISNSFHPYYIINSKGTTPWIVAYVKIHVDEKKDVFNSIIYNSAIYVIDTFSVFSELNIWPDTRLNSSENPIFDEHIPFVIPFLVHKSKNKLRWKMETTSDHNPKHYIDSITKDINFFMPESTIILGFDELDEKNPSKLIDNFINRKDNLNKKSS